MYSPTKLWTPFGPPMFWFENAHWTLKWKDYAVSRSKADSCSSLCGCSSLCISRKIDRLRAVWAGIITSYHREKKQGERRRRFVKLGLVYYPRGFVDTFTPLMLIPLSRGVEYSFILCDEVLQLLPISLCRSRLSETQRRVEEGPKDPYLNSPL